MFYVIPYDIPDDRRRNQLAKALKGFGSRVQYSVFEAHLNRTQYQQMKRIVSDLLNPDEDAIRYYTLCRTCCRRIEVPALGKVTPNPKTIIV